MEQHSQCEPPRDQPCIGLPHPTVADPIVTLPCAELEGLFLIAQVQRESEVYERTLQKLNQQLQASLASMAGEKNALLLSLTGLQDQFEGLANAVYTADETVVGEHSTVTLPLKDCKQATRSFSWGYGSFAAVPDSSAGPV